MKIERFEDIKSWQKGKELSLFIYKAFKENKDYGFKDQIQRAAVSVCNNIAEGFERQSNQEFYHFLHIAKGSCGEVRSMAYLAKDLSYITEDNFNFILKESIEISGLLMGLIKSLKNF